MKHFQGTKQACKTRQAADDTAAGLPAKGKHHGGGRHVEMTDDPASPGWSQHAQGIRKHPAKAGSYAYRDDDSGTKLDASWTVSVDVVDVPTVETR